MQSPEVIRRSWPGFGDCRITVASSEASAPGSLGAKIFSGLPRLFSRFGLGSLSFTVDPAWILKEGHPPVSPIVSQFLRVHRIALAEEWKSRQGSQVTPVPETSPRPTPIPVPLPKKLKPTPLPTLPLRPKPQGEKGLPSWFGWYCEPGDSIKPRPKPVSREDGSGNPPASQAGSA
jgi:hypothetical protein